MIGGMWDEILARLAATLAGLDDGGYVVVGEPEGEPAPARGLLRRRPPPPPRRYVQAARRGTWLYAECVGSTAFGGDWEVTSEQDAAIRAAGWLTPDQDDETGTRPSYPNYWRTLPATHAPEVAALLVEGLRVLEVDPEGLAWEEGR
jgi:hypothetical protein